MISSPGRAVASGDHDRQTPTSSGWSMSSPRIAASAVIRRSSPAAFWSSPIAISNAIRALASAAARASLPADARIEMALIESRPTATTVSRTIKLSVITSAKPRVSSVVRI